MLIITLEIFKTQAVEFLYDDMKEILLQYHSLGKAIDLDLSGLNFNLGLHVQDHGQ